MNLLRLISWPYVRKHMVRTTLSAAGIVLGVSVFVGMHTANQSVLLAFSRSIERIAGKTELQITAGDAGFGEDVLEKVQSMPAVRVAVPVIEAVVESRLAGQGNLLVLGIDMTGDRSLREYDLESGDDVIVDDPLVFLAQPDSLIISKELSDRSGVANGGRLSLVTAEGEKEFTIRGTMKAAGLATAFGGDIAVMDVYAAQQMFGRGRTFDRIDLALAEGVTRVDAEREIEALLGPAFDVQPPGTRGEQAESLVAGYTMMVNVSSAFALFIGMFIIYNSFAIAVTQRRSEIGILRALGATRSQITRLFLGESVVLGLLGASAGVGLGVLLARAIASSISALIGNLYGVAEQASDVATSPLVLGLSLAIGVAASLMGAVIPARQAAQIDPVHALKKGSIQILSVREGWRRALVAVALALVSALSLAIAEVRPIFYLGYAMAIAAGVLAAPVLALGLAKGLRPLLKLVWPIEGALAADSLIQSPRRTSACVAALMLSLALITAFSGMARASHASIVSWMDTTLNPDLFVMPSQKLDNRTTRFPAVMAGELASLQGVERVQTFRYNRMTLQDKPVMIAAIEIASFQETTRSNPVSGNIDDMYRRTAAGEGLIVSDNFAQLRQVSVGDVLDIPAPYGVIRLPIVGVIVDYTDQQGTIFMDRAVFVEHWHDDAVSDFHVWVAPQASIGNVRQRIIERYAGERHVFVLTNEDSRQYILGIADQWFGLMNLQIAIAVLVAVLGIVNTLTVSIADRRRELGVLRAVGAMRRQIRQTIKLEALSVAVIGLILGCALGAVNLYYILEMVQRDIIGMRLDYQYPTTTMAALIPVMLATAFVAALWPSEAAVRCSLVEALEYE